jgi:predicted ATP-grasp superfamily ATP-dependent carboligase
LEKSVLCPSADPYAEFVDENLNILKEYYLIPMEKQGLWTEVMKKESLIKLAQQNDVLVPETVEIDDPNFKEKVVGMIEFNCIVKPTDSPKFVSEFRKKIFYCDNIKELEDSIERAKDKQIEVFVQRIISGFDDHMYTFDFYVDRTGKVTHWTTCRKLRQFPINFEASVYTEQKYIKELADIGIPFIEKIGYRGFGEIEFKKDKKIGRYYLIEINTRTTNLDNLLYK